MRRPWMWREYPVGPALQVRKPADISGLLTSVRKRAEGYDSRKTPDRITIAGVALATWLPPASKSRPLLTRWSFASKSKGRQVVLGIRMWCSNIPFDRRIWPARGEAPDDAVGLATGFDLTNGDPGSTMKAALLPQQHWLPVLEVDGKTIIRRHLTHMGYTTRSRSWIR